MRCDFVGFVMRRLNLLCLDREAVTELDAKLKEERKQSGEMVSTCTKYI